MIPDDQRGVHEVNHAHGHNMYAAIRGTLIGREGQDTAPIVLPKTVRGGGGILGGPSSARQAFGAQNTIATVACTSP